MEERRQKGWKFMYIKQSACDPKWGLLAVVSVLVMNTEM